MGQGGELLRFCARHPWRPAHIHFVITAPGYEKVTTHLFCRGDKYLFEDAVFAVIDSLILDWPVRFRFLIALRFGHVDSPR